METVDVFVYGTLKPGGLYFPHYCGAYLKQSQAAQVRGLLYDLPHLGYPVVTLGNGWVKGYLFTLRQAALPGLDRLEGYAPQNGDLQEEYGEVAYTRQQVMVFDLSGCPLQEAWIYTVDRAPAEAVLLPNGEWNIS